MPGRWALESWIASIGSSTATEPMAITRPQPRSRMPGRTRWRNAIGERTSARWAASHCSRVNASGSGPAGGPPVLAT